VSAVATPPAWPAELPQHLSSTQLSLFATCAEKFRRRYVLGERTPAGSALVLGGAVGATIEHYLTEKIGEQQHAPIDEVFGQTLSDKVDAQEVVWGEDESYNKTQATGLALVQTWVRDVAPSINPVAVEHKVELRIPNLPVPVIGYVDVVERGRTIENKTAGRKPNRGEPKPDWIIQGWIYRAALGLPHEWHCGIKTQKPYWITPASEGGASLRVEWDERLSSLAYRLVGNRARQIHAMYLLYGPDEAWPDGIDHEMYGNSPCSYCSYRPACDYWTHERTAA
jgi:hypothetical protein